MSIFAKFQLSSWSRSCLKVWGGGGAAQEQNICSKWLLCLTSTKLLLSWFELRWGQLSYVGFWQKFTLKDITINAQFSYTYHVLCWDENYTPHFISSSFTWYFLCYPDPLIITLGWMAVWENKRRLLVEMLSTFFKGEIRDIGSSAAMKGYWIGIARQYFLFNLRQNSVAGLVCEPVLSAK